METNIDEIVRNSLNRMELEDLDKIKDSIPSEDIIKFFNEPTEKWTNSHKKISSSYLILGDKIICPWCGGEMSVYSGDSGLWYYECKDNCKKSYDEKIMLLGILHDKIKIEQLMKNHNTDLIKSAKKISKSFFIEEINSVIENQHNLLKQFKEIE
jgi:ssDNA-binding Zn-finger/Zn-ribbon topoisomerase 1